VSGLMPQSGYRSGQHPDREPKRELHVESNKAPGSFSAHVEVPPQIMWKT
jgi:hypothetical protein